MENKQTQQQIDCMKDYAAFKTAEMYSKAEVTTIIKQVLEDAAERATIKTEYIQDIAPVNPRYKTIVDKSSITNINVEKYLTK
jgi:hypothetical protein